MLKICLRYQRVNKVPVAFPGLHVYVHLSVIKTRLYRVYITGYVIGCFCVGHFYDSTRFASEYF